VIDAVVKVCPEQEVLLVPELLLHVFYYLSAEELIRVVGMVCKLWYDVSCDESLWRDWSIIQWDALPEMYLYKKWKQFYKERYVMSRFTSTITQTICEQTEEKSNRVPNYRLRDMLIYAILVLCLMFVMMCAGLLVAKSVV